MAEHSSSTHNGESGFGSIPIKGPYDISDDSASDVFSFIEVRSNPVKRIWLKVISFFVSFAFLSQQVGFADIYDYKRLGGIAEELLPSAAEQDRRNKYSPSYLKRQQQKHEEIVRQKMGKEDLMGQ
ncbi:MAG: hypothetical protein ABIA77_07020, partial [Candidatus Omnitrophota bacterium]